MADVSSVQEYYDTLPQRFNAAGAKGMNCVFQFNLTGEGGFPFHVSIDDGRMSTSQGAHASPTVTLTMGAADYLKMVNGKLSGQMAFMTGKMKVAGNIPMAMKMQQVLPPNK
jgi:putative sterol carrier protein